MSQKTEELKEQLKNMFSLLQTLRDEIRLQIHLAGMDAKSEWENIERDLDRLRSEKISTEVLEGLKEMASRLREFRERYLSGREEHPKGA